MASLSFTAANGTGLEVLDAKCIDVNVSYPVTTLEIQNNQLQSDAAYVNGGFLYNDGQSEDQESQIVFIAGAAASAARRACVRAGGANGTGYAAGFTSYTGSDYTTIQLTKDGAYLAQASGLTIPWASNHTCKIKATTNGANVDIVVYVDDAPVITKSDTSAVLSGGLPGAYITGSATVTDFAFDDWTDNVSAGASITSVPASVARGETGVIIGISGGSATQGAATVTFGGEACTITSYPAGGTGNVLVTIPSTIALQHDVTGYTFVYTDNDTTFDTSAAVPFNEPAGWDYTNITVTPSLLYGSVFYGFTGTPAPAIGGQVVYESVMLPDSIPFTVGPDGELIWDSAPTRNQTASIYYIAADGILTDVETFTWVVPSNIISNKSGMGLKQFGRLGVM